MHILLDLLMNFLLHLLQVSFGGHFSRKANGSSDQNRQYGDESVMQAGVKAENDTSFCGDSSHIGEYLPRNRNFSQYYIVECVVLI